MIHSKKEKTIELFAVCDGTFMNIENVPDPIFSAKALGDGFAIVPGIGKIKLTSPIKGKVTALFPTKHAIALKTDDHIEVLLHMGIDTVDLQGEGFNIIVQENDVVDEHTVLAEMDVEYILDHGKHKNIIVVLPNLKTEYEINFSQTAQLKQSQLIGYVSIR